MTFHDASRLKVLEDYRVLDTAPEEALDNITQLTAKIFRVPISFIALVDRDRQWFKSRVGLKPNELSRTDAFCDHTIRADTILVVPDATQDERFKANPLVTGELGIRFYCGIPLRTPEGHNIGTLCVIDRTPRWLTPDELKLLEPLGRQVEIELELRRRLMLLSEAFEAGTSRDLSQRDRTQQMFVSMVVHDLRSPLTSITMLAALVQGADEESREALAELFGEAERMRRMLTDVLDICLNQVDALRLRRAEFDVSVLLRQVARRMRRLTDTRDQSLLLDTPNAPLLVSADAGLIERVLENLVGNAIHHGPAGKPIEVLLRQPTPERVRVEIRDQGRPIPAEFRHSIFKVFERLELATDALHRGHGLGLSFCRIAVEAHGGAVGVLPGPSGGNTFWFEIPVGRSPSDA